MSPWPYSDNLHVSGKDSKQRRNAMKAEGLPTTKPSPASRLSSYKLSGGDCCGLRVCPKTFIEKACASSASGLPAQRSSKHLLISEFIETFAVKTG